MFKAIAKAVGLLALTIFAGLFIVSQIVAVQSGAPLFPFTHGYYKREYLKHCVWHAVPQGDYNCGD